MKALILTAGLGSRLYPITRITPKPLLDVNEKPVLAHIVDNLDSSERIEEISIIYPHNFESQFMAFYDFFKYSRKIDMISDKNRNVIDMPGSIGGIAYVVKHKKINEDLLVVAGDNLFDFRIDDFINFFSNHKKTSIAVYDCGDKKRACNFGVVELDKQNRILNFEEKPLHPKTSLVSTLCYVLAHQDLPHLEKTMFKENAGELIKYLIEKNHEVYGFQFRGKWFDIGSHADLEKARREF